MSSSEVVALDEGAADWDSELLRALYELAFSTPDREVAGVLVGTLVEGAGPVPSQVRAAIPATQGFTVGQASLFGHQTWAQVHQTMAQHYGGLEVVGWYVSRPGHGTVPTESDIVNHQRWFARPDQLLLLVDSLSHRAAVYGWGPDGLRQITEGPIARRYTHRPPPGFPVAAAGMLAVIGVVIGALAYLVAQVIGG